MKHLITLISCLALMAQFALAQTQTNFEQTLNLPLVAPEAVPTSSTFWLWSYRSQFGSDFGVPIPFNPWGSNVNVYAFTNDFLGEIQYVIDDTPIVQAQAEAAASGPTRAGAFAMSADESSDAGSSDSPNFTAFPSNSLCLEITGVTNAIVPNGGTVLLTLHGTVENQTYEILSRDNITNTGWLSESMVIGAAGQNWTATTVSIGARTNTLFLWARSYVDTDGDGLPDWWEIANGLDPNSADTGNTGVPDGYKDLAGDGWTTIYKYEHGIPAHQYITPPAPVNVRATLDNSGTNVMLTWQSGGGTVSSYTVLLGYEGASVADFSPLATVSSSTTSYTDVGEVPPQIDFYIFPVYIVRATFANGATADSLIARPFARGLNSELHLVRGPGGDRYFALEPIPADLSQLIVSHYDTDINVISNIYSKADLATGIVPAGHDSDNTDLFFGNAISTNGALGQGFVLFFEPAAEEWTASGTYSPVFVDARAHLKENLKFLLRSATISHPFSYAAGNGLSGHSPDALLQPESNLARPESTSDYEYYGFRYYSGYYGFSVLQELRPVAENFIFSNYVYNAQSSLGVDSYGFCGDWFFRTPLKLIWSLAKRVKARSPLRR